MLKIAEYTRINGKIGKVKEIVLNGNNYEDSGIYLENEKFILGKEEIHKLKSSKNIIDLVGVGDFVNGMRIVAKDSDNRLYVAEDLGQPYDREFYNGCFEYTILDEKFKIKTILTKEQFENMTYEVEE